MQSLIQLEFDVVVNHLRQREGTHDDDQTNGTTDEPTDCFRSSAVSPEDKVEATNCEGDGCRDDGESLKELE